MTLDERIETALLAQDCDTPLTAVLALVHALHAEGMTKQAIAEAYHAALQRHRDDECDEEREAASAALAETLGFLTGSCARHARLLPDEPDAKL